MSSDALKKKELGNAAYKAKKFDEAIAFYDEAIALDGTDITFYNNKGAVHFEKAEYDLVISVCKTAVEVGQSNRSPYQHVAKSLARIGKAYTKKSDPKQALVYYDKAITEHRSDVILKERQEVLKTIKELDRLAYECPEKAIEEKNKGNELFKKGDYAGAIPFYTEAIKRNPRECVPFSNRAACYTKLLEFGLAMQDCDTCITLDPMFIKGYLRKAALLRIEQPQEAFDMYQKALEIDENNNEAKQGVQFCMNALRNQAPEERAKAAMNNPEIQEILKDPAMQVILEQMQKDPTAAQEHLKNPAVADKFSKLVKAGIVSLR